LAEFPPFLNEKKKRLKFYLKTQEVGCFRGVSGVFQTARVPKIDRFPKGKKKEKVNHKILPFVLRKVLSKSTYKLSIPASRKWRISA